MYFPNTLRCLIAGMILSFSACGAMAQTSETSSDLTTERSYLLQQHQLQEKFRAFERNTRHFHYVLVNAILSSYGGWRNLPEDYNATQAGLIDGVIEKMAPATNRMKARASGYPGISENEIQKLTDAVIKFQLLFPIGIRIRDHLYAEEFDEANGLYYKQALPLFEEIWSTNYTLLTEAARRIPRR